MNIINVIAPYKYLDMWVFDDEKVGLVQEPFVSGADLMIDRIVEFIPNAEKGFIMIFSGEKFPEADICLEWRGPESSGNQYYSKELDMEGWLCPALLKYFTDAPEKIYIKIKEKK
ncbi:DUF6717 family protein [Budvicia aquatica]|nr:DUF6717 family protein [Budvicia aquatica]VFS48566.1 Uncharacterised protein [Budvicia aquatica]